MFEFWRNWRKTDAEKQQEALNAYLDDALSADDRQAFEKEMARDEALQQAVANLRVLRTQLRQLPSRPVPRNFMLDPAKYGRPARQPLFQFYPALRAATVLTGLFLIVALAGGLLTLGGGSFEVASDTAAVSEMVQEEAAPLAEAPEAETAVENFAIESEEDAVDEEAELSDEEPLAGVAAEESGEAEADVMAEEAPPAETAAEIAEEEAVEEALAPVAEDEAAPPEAADAADGGLETLAPSPTPLLTMTLTPTVTAPPAVARNAEATAVAPLPTVVPSGQTAVSPPTNPLLVVAIVLLVVFAVLLTLTLWVRRRL